jgi:ribonuclease Y
MRYLALGSRGFPARGADPAKPIWVRERTSRVLPIYALLLNLVVTLVTAALVFAVWVANRKRIAAETIGRAEEQALRTLKDADRDAETRKKEALLEAKEKAHELLMDTERQASHLKQAAVTLEQTLDRRQSTLADRQNVIDRVEKELTTRDRVLGEREKASAIAAAKYDRLVAQQQHELERVASLTADEAKDLLLKQIEGEARHEAANLLKRLDAEARETAVDKAKHYITEAIQRCGAEHAIETTVSVVDLPSDDLKGRIIGREGRNIRALELATGIDLIIDDTPGAIILSGFDPYRREIAKQAIERLIADGRIHPARIEEVVQKVKEETDEAMRKDGAGVAFELGLHDLHPEIQRLMGRLKYRTSYGQNVLSHSAEVARLAGIMAREVGLDAHVAVRAAFLHDIGKAIDREMEGTHLQIGIDFLRKHGESEAVVMAMAAHHMDIDWPSLEAMIVQAADAISAARPGARRDILESYVKRLEKLEGIADSFKGVSKSFALQAGREIRIMVESENVSDEEAVWLSKDIARRIESELEYPGQIKVTVIRETRAVDYAK